MSTCGQSYKYVMLVNYDYRVELSRKLPIFTSVKCFIGLEIDLNYITSYEWHRQLKQKKFNCAGPWILFFSLSLSADRCWIADIISNGCWLDDFLGGRFSRVRSLTPFKVLNPESELLLRHFRFLDEPLDEL